MSFFYMASWLAIANYLSYLCTSLLLLLLFVIFDCCFFASHTLSIDIIRTEHVCKSSIHDITIVFLGSIYRCLYTF